MLSRRHDTILRFLSFHWLSCGELAALFFRDSVHERRTSTTQEQIHFHQTTTLTPAQYIAGLTDFGPGRSKLFGNSADEYLKVHHLGRMEADVTEGSGGIWERLLYDWSSPR